MTVDIKHQAYLTDQFIDCLKRDNDKIKKWLKDTGITNIPEDILQSIMRSSFLKMLPTEAALEIFQKAGADNIINEALKDKDYITYSDQPQTSIT